MAKIHIENGIISSSADYGLYRNTSQIVNIQDGEFRVLGDLIAENYIVSSSVTSLTYQSLSGSTIFGDSTDDTHQFTGSMLGKGNLTLGGTNIPTLHLDGLVDAVLRIDKAASYRAAHLRFDTGGSADWFIGTPDSDTYGDGDELYFGT